VKPTLHQNAGIFTLSWEQEQVSMRLDRVRDHSDNLTAEVCVTGVLPGSIEPTHLHQARLNLTSTAARKTLAKHLNERLELDWDAIIEEACVLVLRAYRQGEPAVAVHDIPKREGPRFRLEPILLWQLPNHIYGDGGVGKSYLAAFWAVLISAGYQFCGLTPSPCRVLYLDWEAGPEEIRARIEAIETGLGDPKCSDILYRFSCAPLARDIEEVQAIVIENEIELVIIDSMGEALGGEKGDPREPVVEYFRALRSLRICSLTVDHVSKGNGKESSIYGSVYKRNLSRNVFEVRKAQEPGDTELKLALYHRKTNTGPLMRPMGYSISFSGEGVYFSTTDVRDVPELAAGMGLPARIRDYLLHSIAPIEVKEIVEAMGGTYPAVTQALNAMERQGRAVRFTEFKQPIRWAIAGQEEGQ